MLTNLTNTNITPDWPEQQQEQKTTNRSCLYRCGSFSNRIWLHCFGSLGNGSRWRCQMSRLWCLCECSVHVQHWKLVESFVLIFSLYVSLTHQNTSNKSQSRQIPQVDTCTTAPASASLGASAGGSDGITCSSSGFEGKQKNHILKWTFVAKFMKSWRNLTSCLHILQLQELWTPDLPEKHTTNEASSSRGLRLVPTGLAWAALAAQRQKQWLKTEINKLHCDHCVDPLGTKWSGCKVPQTGLHKQISETLLNFAGPTGSALPLRVWHLQKKDLTSLLWYPPDMNGRLGSCQHNP